jgi:(p)ppGpp synthase/HD superfamily hydrolase
MTERPLHPSSTVKPGPRLTEAFEFARRAHDGQFRKGTAIPYISHPLAVCSLALSFGASENEAMGALLHDTAEDGGGEVVLVDIRKRFGPAVEAIVRACSDSLTNDLEQKAPWHERKEHHLKLLATADRSVRLVAASDKLHNLQSILADLQTEGPDLWKRFKAGPKDQIWYYAFCLGRLGADPAEPWSRPLRESVAALRAHVENNP